MNQGRGLTLPNDSFLSGTYAGSETKLTQVSGKGKNTQEEEKSEEEKKSYLEK